MKQYGAAFMRGFISMAPLTIGILVALLWLDKLGTFKAFAAGGFAACAAMGSLTEPKKYMDKLAKPFSWLLLPSAIIGILLAYSPIAYYADNLMMLPEGNVTERVVGFLAGMGTCILILLFFNRLFPSKKPANT